MGCRERERERVAQSAHLAPNQPSTDPLKAPQVPQILQVKAHKIPPPHPLASGIFLSHFAMHCKIISDRLNQGQILAVWILAAKLPNSDLNFAVDFGVDLFLLFSPRETAQKKSAKKSPANPPRNLSRKVPLGFLQKPFLET